MNVRLIQNKAYKNVNDNNIQFLNMSLSKTLSSRIHHIVISNSKSFY